MEIIDSFDANKLDSLSDKRKQGHLLEPDMVDKDEVDGELKSSYNELNEAKQRLRLLEMKIQTLENRLAKKYPDVVFLNYKNRKRILVLATVCFVYFQQFKVFTNLYFFHTFRLLAVLDLLVHILSII